LLLLLFPTAIVPYTYASSFLFTDEGSAQNFTILHNFFLGSLAPITVFVLRLIKSTSSIGDVVIWFFRWNPVYNSVGGVVLISLNPQIHNDRSKTAPDEMDITSAGADVMFLCLHFVFWSTLVLLIELGLFN
jgi:ATP-binding cassette subfamily A (ABC1) protein 3